MTNRPDAPLRPSPRDIIEAEAERYGVPLADMVSGEFKGSFLSRVRHLAVAEIRRVHPEMRPYLIAPLLGLNPSNVWQSAGRWRHLPQPNPLDVVREFAAGHRMAARDILGTYRHDCIAKPRSACMREVARRCPGLSSTDIVRVFNRHHTTVLHALGRITRDRGRVKRTAIQPAPIQPAAVDAQH